MPLIELPSALLRYLPDSEIEVVSWSAATSELVLRVRKEIGPEVGLLRFAGAWRVHLSSRFTIAGIVQNEKGIGGVTVGTGESMFVIEEAWGDQYFVIAESVSYAIEA